MPLGAITGIADGLGSVVMNAVSGVQRRRERNQAHRHHEDAMAVAKRNYEFSREQHAYQQYSNVRQHQREDTQIQRTMADARAAGIHPVAALGMGGQAGVPGNAVNAPSGVGASGSIAAGAKGDMGMLDAYLDIQRFRDDLRNTAAQRNLIDAQAETERYRAKNERNQSEHSDWYWQGRAQQAMSQAGLNSAQYDFVRGQIPLLQDEARKLVSQAGMNEVQAQMFLVKFLREVHDLSIERSTGSHSATMGPGAWGQIRGIISQAANMAMRGANEREIQSFVRQEYLRHFGDR